MTTRRTEEHQGSRHTILDYRKRTLAVQTDQTGLRRVGHYASSPFGALPPDGLARSPMRSVAGRFRLSLHTVWQALAASLSVPLLIRFGRDLPLYEKLSKLAPLRLALEGHQIRTSCCVR
jgi:hypothetical protein